MNLRKGSVQELSDFSEYVKLCFLSKCPLKITQFIYVSDILGPH